MKLSLGFSPCPNDTFIFDAMVHERIDTEGFHFEPKLADVEALNQMAFQGMLDITKLSYHAYAHVRDRYVLLTAGSALGNNCGPLLIAKTPLELDKLSEKRIAIPGRFTTANFLLGLAFPNAGNKIEMVFSEIENAVIKGEVDAGLIIHENRFTYADRGLVKLIDLGEYWEGETGFPIPLGGIAVRRDLPTEIRETVNRILSRSVAHAQARPDDSQAYVKAHAQEMDEQVMKQHIALYVNDYSRDLGEVGKRAVQELFERAEKAGIAPLMQAPLFV